MKYAIAIECHSHDAEVARVWSPSYSCYGGNRTVLRRNLLGQWCVSNGDKKPSLWATVSGAATSKVMKILRDSGHSPMIVEVGPQDHEIRSLLGDNISLILDILKGVALGRDLRDEARALVNVIRRAA